MLRTLEEIFRCLNTLEVKVSALQAQELEKSPGLVGLMRFCYPNDVNKGRKKSESSTVVKPKAYRIPVRCGKH